MGKKQGDATRVKGNAKPSSSAKAAEMLQQISGFGFGSDLPPIGIGTLMEDSFDTNVDSDFRMVLKKLSKKDTLTKLKSLEELKNLIETKSQDDCVAIVSYWSKSYTKLTIDNDRKIRELCQSTHEKLSSKVNKHIAPYIKTIMPYWLLAQSDSYLTASRIAESSFKSTFNDLKQPEVVYFSKDEILNVLHDYLIVQSAKTLSDMKSTSEDEALQKYENILSMSLRALCLFLKYNFSPGSKFFKDISSSGEIIESKLDKIFADQKFWKYSKDNSMRVRSDFFHLLDQLISTVVLNPSLIELEKNMENFKLRKMLKAKIIPLVFYSCDEDNQTCSYYVWQTIQKCLNNFELLNENETNNFWSLMNVKKAFVPKLIALLRSHANGNANNQNIEIVFPLLYPLLVKLSPVFDDNLEEKLTFYKDFCSKIFDACSREINTVKIRFAFASNRALILNSLFDSFSFIYDDFINKTNVTNTSIEFCREVLIKNVFQLYDSYLTNSSNRQEKDVSGFECKFISFMVQILDTDPKSNDEVQSMKDDFWIEIGAILLKKLESDNESELDEEKEIEQTENFLVILNNFCNLFRPLWTNENGKLKQRLEDILKVLFKLFLEKFSLKFESNKETPSRLTFLYLRGLCTLSSNFMSETFLDLFLANTADFADSLTLVDKLKIFNEKFMEKLFNASFDFKSVENREEHVLSSLVELYLFVTLKIASNTNVCKNLDHYIFDTSETENSKSHIETFLNNLVQKLKTNKLDSDVQKCLSQWLFESENLHEFILNKYLNKANFYSNTKFAFDLIEVLVKSEYLSNHNETVIEKFYNSFLQTNIQYLRKIELKDKKTNIEEINHFLEFNSNLLFNLNQNMLTKHINLELLWSILLSYLTLLKSNLGSKSELFNQNLKSSIQKLVSLLFKNYSSDQSEDFSYFRPLVVFMQSALSDDKVNVNDIITELVAEIETLKSPEFVNQLYKSVLLNQSFDFRKMFNSILLPNNSVNSDLMVKFYLDKRLSYLYTDQHSCLMSQSEMSTDWLTLESSNKINYSLIQLNNYLGKPVNDPEFVSNMFPDVYYLILSSVIIEKFYTGPKNVIGLKTELKKFIEESKFFENLFELFSSDERFLHEFIKSIFMKDDLKIELNNMSLFLTYLIDSGLIAKMVKSANLGLFSQNLMSYLSSDFNDYEDLIKIYLFDLPFAKQSIFDNLESLKDNMDHYYGLFDSVLDPSIQKLESFISELQWINTKTGSFDLDDYLFNLKSFNFVLDLLVKYVNFYFDLVNATQDESSLVSTLFNSNEKTAEFLKNNLSKYLLKVLDLFINLKKFINQNLDYLVKNFDIDRFGSGYFFYFKFDQSNSASRNEGLEWQKFLLLDKLNQFLRIFFVDYKLNLDGLRYQQQLSQYFSDHHWDFVLCYSSALSQKLKQPISNNFDERSYLQVFSVSFFDLLDSLAKSVKYRVSDNRPGSYPKQVFSDWNGFFIKEIYDPVLSAFIQLADFYSNSNKSLKYSAKISVNKLGNFVAQIPFERILLNELDPKFNVLDLDLNADKLKSINLSDQLKTVLNYLIPNLKHQISSIQFNSYKILRNLMTRLSDYYRTDSDEGETQMNIMESLPHVLRENFFELTDLFSDLKKSVPFDQNILVVNLHNEEEETDFEHEKAAANVELKEMVDEANNKIMAYLFINRLILDTFSTNNLEFKVKLVNDLRELGFSDHLMHCLFRLMPEFKFAHSKMFQSGNNDFESDFDDLDDKLDEKNDLTFRNEFVEEYSCRLYKFALKSVPAMIRDWWNMQPKRICDQVDKYTTKFVSPILIEDEIRQINRSANLLNNGAELDEDQSTIKIKGMLSTREIVSTYKMKELSMELIIQLPLNHPLGVVKVSSVKRLGVSENEWRNWLLQLTTYLTHQNGSIIQGLQIWKRNVDKKFSGVEECTICYSVIHGTNYQLPKMKCRTCKHMFHSVCLYKWFESSSKSTCPLCRNLF